MSKLTVTLPDELHEQIRQELEAQGITTGQFIEMVVTKYFTKSKEGEKNMATRTIAFQVSEELYRRIKEYLNRYQEVYGRKLTQREFMLQVIEDALSEAEEEFEAATAAEEESPSRKRRWTASLTPGRLMKAMPPKVTAVNPRMRNREMAKVTRLTQSKNKT